MTALAATPYGRPDFLEKSMNTLTLVALGLGLSVDAFAAALGKGATSNARGFVPALYPKKPGGW